MVVVLMKTNERYNTLSAALNIIDPEGTLLPGTVEHNWITGTLISWMDQMEPDEVLRKSKSVRRHLRISAHTIDSPTL